MKSTSLVAFEDIRSGEPSRRTTLKERVYDYIAIHPNCTQMDISRDMGESARKRISELVAEGLIVERGEVRVGRLSYTRYDILQDQLKLVM